MYYVGRTSTEELVASHRDRGERTPINLCDSEGWCYLFTWAGTTRSLPFKPHMRIWHLVTWKKLFLPTVVALLRCDSTLERISFNALSEASLSGLDRRHMPNQPVAQCRLVSLAWELDVATRAFVCYREYESETRNTTRCVYPVKTSPFIAPHCIILRLCYKNKFAWPHSFFLFFFY